MNAVSPTNTQWEVRFWAGNAALDEWTALGLPRTFRIDADHDYAASCACTPYTTICGSCIGINCLLDPIGNPPQELSNEFCDLVVGCMADTIADLQAQIDGIVGTDTFVTFGTDADGNVTTTNADGSAGPLLCAAPCEDTDTTNDTIALAASDDGSSLEITITDSDGNPVTGSIACADLAAILTPCLPTATDTDTFVTFGTDADGNITTTNADGSAGPTMCAAPCDGGPDTDTFVTFGTDADGNITTTNADGTAGPVLCPAPCGDGDPIAFEYVDFDGTVHTTGTFAGAGTPADPYQIPLPTSADDLCDQLATVTESTDPIATTDKLLVLQDDDSCALKTLCSETVSSGGTDFTGQRAGFFIMGCESVPMPTQANPAGGTDWHPEISFPAADFPIGWQQQFEDGFSGWETWMVQTQLDGSTHLWVQVTA
jgi:hypothetical protein